MYSANQIQKLIKQDFDKLKACKTKEEMNQHLKGRTVMVQDGSDWEGEMCDFIEMVGEGKRENWKMRIKTQFGTFLELAGDAVVIMVQQIITTAKEADVIKNDFINKAQ
jgi:hypothetical protein